MHRYTATFDNVNVTGTPPVTRTLLQLVTPSTRRARVFEWGVSFDGVQAAAEPCDVRLVRQGTAGTSSAGSALALDPANPAALVSVLAGFSGTEPSTVSTLARYMVHPQGGTMVMQYPPEREPIMAISDRLAIVVVVGATVNVSGYMMWEE